MRRYPRTPIEELAVGYRYRRIQWHRLLRELTKLIYADKFVFWLEKKLSKFDKEK